MTPIQIAYFKHFLYDKGIQKIYISLYKYNRIKGSPEGDQKGNPESLELFLQQKPYTEVIMKAFYFQMNSAYGYDYWSDINEKWESYWKIHENNFSNEKYITLKGTFSILRQNWDEVKYFELESKRDTYTRMKIEPPIKNEDIETTFDIVPHYDRHTKPVEEEPQEVASEVEEDLLEGFSSVNVNKYHGGKKLNDSIVSVNVRNGSHRVTFSSKRSVELMKEGYKYVKLLVNETSKEVALVFNNQDGLSVSLRRHSGNSTNVSINSIDVTNKLAKFFGVKETYYSLCITAAIKQTNCMIFKFKYLKD